VRDHDLEHDEALAAGEDREKIAALEPRYKTVMVPRPPEEFTDFAPYQPFVDAWLAAEPVVVPPTLADVRMRASAEVDRAAGSARARYITIVAGQEGTYIEKEKQAEQFRAAGYPTKAIPLMIDGEAQASGLSAQQGRDDGTGGDLSAGYPRHGLRWHGAAPWRSAARAEPGAGRCQRAPDVRLHRAAEAAEARHDAGVAAIKSLFRMTDGVTDTWLSWAAMSMR
jgi:hypothetical protein